jgi:hypothetical protein
LINFYLDYKPIAEIAQVLSEQIRGFGGFCIGKANWHLIDTLDGVKARAIIYRITETAKTIDSMPPYDRAFFIPTGTHGLLFTVDVRQYLCSK